MQYNIPRLVIAAPMSGSGKTTVTVGLLAHLAACGQKVRSFKIGPDYIDTGWHKQASGCAAHNLDSYLVPPETMRKIFVENSHDADIVIIEGVMGLYDGGSNGVSSTAEIARLLDAPIVLVIDAKAMGASAAAMALGFKQYDPNINIAGVILNRLGSATHEEMIRSAMAALAIPVFGAIRRDENLVMPERHLGLVPESENSAAASVVANLQTIIGQAVDVPMIIAVAQTASPLIYLPPVSPVGDVKVSIAVAQDEAFNFYYPESLATLEQAGAMLIPFSPLNDQNLPDVDGIILGGGFPEMFSAKLSANENMRHAIKNAATNGIPIYAECGGYMYLHDSITDLDGRDYPMVGAISGKSVMEKKLRAVGYVTANMRQETVLGPKGARLKGHEFHFSTAVAEDETAAFDLTKTRNSNTHIDGYADKNILASYLHIHFAGCPEAAAYFVDKCLQYRERQQWAN